MTDKDKVTLEVAMDAETSRLFLQIRETGDVIGNVDEIEASRHSYQGRVWTEVTIRYKTEPVFE